MVVDFEVGYILSSGSRLYIGQYKSHRSFLVTYRSCEDNHIVLIRGNQCFDDGSADTSRASSDSDTCHLHSSGTGCRCR